MPVKYVFVTGGVVSGLGKGITAASLGRLLKARGYKVTMQKFDMNASTIFIDSRIFGNSSAMRRFRRILRRRPGKTAPCDTLRFLLGPRAY